MAVDRLRAVPDGIGGSNGAQITGIVAVAGGARTSRSCSRRGALPGRVPDASRRPRSRRRSARTRCDQALRAAIAGLIVVAIFLLVFYRFLGVVAVLGLGIYAALPVRHDPALRRHADAAGLRRHDPHARRRGRREHRHLRTHQGRGARRQIRARGDLDGLREGLRDDHRRERRHRDHRPAPVRPRDLGRARLRLHAPARHRALDRHRRLRDPRVPRPARRLQAGSTTPSFMGAEAREIPRWQRIDIVGKRRIWFAIAAVS